MLSINYSRKKATVIGYMGLLLWSTGALATTKICHLPTLQVLTTTFIFSFLISALWLTKTKNWPHIKSQPWYVWIIGVAGICLQQFLYISAFKNAPAIQADILILLWPILVILLSTIVTRENLKTRHIISGAMGLMSVILLNYSNQGFNMFSQWHPGYYYALSCAVLWSLYTLCTRYFRNIPPTMIGMYYGIGVLIIFPFHLMHEDYVTPNYQQWLILGYIGIFNSGVAYFCWDFGIKKGNMHLLATLSYGNSILSITLLFLFADCQAQDMLGWSCVLIFTAGFVATDWFGNKIKYFAAWIQSLTWKKKAYTFPKIYSLRWDFVNRQRDCDHNLVVFWKINSQSNCPSMFRPQRIQFCPTHSTRILGHTLPAGKQTKKMKDTLRL